jgi:hypothetical protein
LPLGVGYVPALIDGPFDHSQFAASFHI